MKLADKSTRGAGIIFALVLVMCFLIPLYSWLLADDSQDTAGQAPANNSSLKDSVVAENNTDNNIQIRFTESVADKNEKSERDGSGMNIREINPAQKRTIAVSLLHLNIPEGTQVKKPAPDLLKTVLELATTDGGYKLDFYLQNIAQQDLFLYFGSGQMFDILVVNQKGEEVYRWSSNKCFTTAIVNVELKKNDKLTFAEVWDCRNNQGTPVPQGQYTVKVIIPAKLKDGTTIAPESLTASAEIEIVY